MHLRKGPVASLRGVSSIGGGIAWASGTNGTVIRTVDGGKLWQSCAVPAGADHLDFRAIQAFDVNTAFAMSSGKGDLSRLYKTTDGCHSWTLLFTNGDEDGFWDALSLPRPEKGWILGDPVRGMFTLLYLQTLERCTETGAQRTCRMSTELANASTASLRADPAEQGAFAASNTAYFTFRDAYRVYRGLPPRNAEEAAQRIQDADWFGTGGKAGAYVYTHDINKHDRMQYGFPPAVSWEKAAVPIGNGTESSGIFSLCFIRQRDGTLTDGAFLGIAVGGDYLNPAATEHTAAYSLDSGRSWHAPQNPPGGYRSAVAYDAAQKLWITVGPNGTDVSSDGRNWHALRTGGQDAADADKKWNAISLPFAVGPDGRIGKLRHAVTGAKE